MKLRKLTLLLFAAALLFAQADVALQRAIRKETIEGDLKGAIEQYQKILTARGVGREVAATALLHLGQCHEKLGSAEARKAYERLVMEFADQAEPARTARVRLAALAKGAWSSQESGLQGRRIIGPSNHLGVAVSPDGRYIAYCCTVVYEVATGREQKFSTKGSSSGYRFSADGADIAYVAQEPGGTPELRLIKRTGSDERTLLRSPGIALIDWMPDGKDLLVTLAREDKTSDLALVPVAGGVPRSIKSPVSFSDGRLSLDGKYLAYRAQPAATGAAWVTRVSALDGSSDAMLAERPANARNIGWTPDGRVLFYSAAGGSEGIWAVRVAGGKPLGLPERIVGGRIEDSIQPLGLTRGGAFFYYKMLVDNQLHLMEIGLVPGALKPSSVLTSSLSPDWSPDGRYLAYGGMDGLISIRTLATGEERTLWTGLTGVIMSLRWFPDQRALAAQGPGPEGGMNSVRLHRVDLNTGSLSDIMLGQNWREFGANPTFSPDRTSIIYKAFDSVRQVSTLTRYNLETRRQEVLLERKPPQYVMAFAALPQSGQIAVALAEGNETSSVQLLDPATRELRSVYTTPRGNYIPASNVLHWMPDGKSLLVVTAPSATAGSPMSLFRIPVSGGQPEKLFEAGTIMQVRVHPDGRQVAIDTRGIKMETWVVDNLFAAAKK